jgi:hypothetical protein
MRLARCILGIISQLKPRHSFELTRYTLSGSGDLPPLSEVHGWMDAKLNLRMQQTEFGIEGKQLQLSPYRAAPRRQNPNTI